MDNKQFIVENSINLFSKKGYEAVGVQEICEVSKITKPTLYYYFKSKAGLLQYISDTKGKELLERIQTALTYNHDFIKGLTDVLKAEINFAMGNTGFFDLHCTLLNSPDDSEQKNIYTPVITDIQKSFDDFFISSCAEFGNMRGKEKLYATLFHNNVVSTAILISKGKIKYSEETIYRIIHSLVYGMAN
ncbi:MAG: TetR/AcrR family transcriptional regulator [Treponema sp.]|uniref:TetR/AcrR family transcriptional regulator n=1 Tax=Treponema sp. TaxID=166 RepID=UPI00298E2B03|nr:helix-turn-helix domain-containing protein [Treponema sp.]MCQ2601636.1 TetR/AcrR family transcriptional regulator [Treponema sp.]